MADQYIAFDLSPGQLPPTGSTGSTISGTGEIIWVGTSGTFNSTASFGTILDTDPTPAGTIDNRPMTQQEIDDYLT